MFTEHFKSLYQPNTSNADLDFANNFETLLNTTVAGPTPFIDTATINDCLSSVKYRKTPGHDGIYNEHIIYGSPVLAVRLSLLFNASLRHGFVPNDNCFGVILPLLKNKHGDASKLDMYRGITLSCCLFKLFESVLSRF